MKKAIIAISFGSSMDHVIDQYITPVEDYLQDEFNEMKVIRAFTSNFIRRKLANRGLSIYSVQEAIDRLLEEDFKEIILQPLHIISGFEYEKVEQAFHDYKDTPDVQFKLSTPLLYENADYEKAITALKSHLPMLGSGEALLFMGHGTKHPANASYFALTHYLKECCPHYYLANVEETPILEDAIALLHKGQYEKVYLIPFMLVAGDHALNDMASDEETSWKSRLLAEGFEVHPLLTGLGALKEVHVLFTEKVKQHL